MKATAVVACLSVATAVLVPHAPVAAAEAPAAAPPPPTVAEAQPGPLVHLESNSPGTTLQQRHDRGVVHTVWQTVCTAPCDLHLDSEAFYRISGREIPTSWTFSLPRETGEVRINAKSGQKGKYWLGAALSLIALPNLGSAAIFFFGPAKTNKDATSFLVLGIGFTAVAAVLLGIGLPKWYANRTSVEMQ